jgi:hypothetical protein
VVADRVVAVDHTVVVASMVEAAFTEAVVSVEVAVFTVVLLFGAALEPVVAFAEVRQYVGVVSAEVQLSVAA